MVVGKGGGANDQRNILIKINILVYDMIENWLMREMISTWVLFWKRVCWVEMLYEKCKAYLTSQCTGSVTQVAVKAFGSFA